MSTATHTLTPTAKAVMIYAHALCRMGVKAHGGRHSDYMRESLRLAWEHLKADAAERARKLARYEREARIAAEHARQLEMFEAERPAHLPRHTRGFAFVPTGRIQSSRW